MKQLIHQVTGFFRREGGDVGVDAFLIVVFIMIGGAINIAVRAATDPVCYRVLRMPPDSRWPMIIGLALTVAATAWVLVFSYQNFGALHGTLVGDLGRTLGKYF